MATQKARDRAYMEMAYAISKLSSARRLKVGSIIVSAKGYGVIAEGYNGTPSGFDNNCEDEYIRAEGVVIDHDHIDHEGIERLKLAYPEMFSDEPAVGETFMVTKAEVLHAESNAITKVARSTSSSHGGTLYCTTSPCVHCAKLIIQAGIKRVVYARLYRNDLGIQLLQKAEIPVDVLDLYPQHDSEDLDPQDEGRCDPDEDKYRHHTT